MPEFLPQAVADDQTAVSDRDQVERGVRGLAPEHRIIIVLHYYLDLPLVDAAAAVGVPVGTAKSRLNWATQALSATLDADARAPRVQTEVTTASTAMTTSTACSRPGSMIRSSLLLRTTWTTYSSAHAGHGGGPDVAQLADTP